MTTTKIQWTDKVWNAVRGCARVSHGCENCYAERVAVRFSGKGQPYEGLVKITNGHPQWTGKIHLAEDKLDEPLHWKKPCRVFVNSMSDLFHEDVPFEFIDKVFAVMANCWRHTFQILTKRPARMLEYMRGMDAHPSDRLDNACFGMMWLDEGACAVANFVNGWSRWRDMPDDGNPLNGTVRRWPLPNVWLGVSVEDRKTWLERSELLKQTPAAVHFISYEPALYDIGQIDLSGVQWVIVGGESGPGARPFNIQWARNVIAQCKASGVPCFVKQLGSNCITRRGPKDDRLYPLGTEQEIKVAAEALEYELKFWNRIAFRDRKGGDMSEWPEDLRVREYPSVDTFCLEETSAGNLTIGMLTKAYSS